MAVMIDIESRRFTADEYERVVEAGIFTGDERVELLDGVICSMSPEGKRHVVAIELAREVLSSKLGTRAGMRVQHPLSVSRESEPEPDVVIVEARDPRAYLAGHPTTALLVNEVAYYSLQKDLSFKAGLYARAGIAEYWVENLVDDTVEVFRQPESGSYRTRMTLRRGEKLSLVSFPDVEIEVDELLP